MKHQGTQPGTSDTSRYSSDRIWYRIWGVSNLVPSGQCPHRGTDIADGVEKAHIHEEKNCLCSETKQQPPAHVVAADTRNVGRSSRSVSRREVR